MTTDKGKYIEKDRKRWAKYCNIPFASSMPENFPPNTLHVMRAVAQVEQQYPEKLTTVISALYTAMWVDLKSIQEPAIFEDIMASILGKQEAKNLVEEVRRRKKKQSMTCTREKRKKRNKK
jgi:2-hydroxychromene-2-carboxylate isomerase